MRKKEKLKLGDIVYLFKKPYDHFKRRRWIFRHGMLLSDPKDFRGEECCRLLLFGPLGTLELSCFTSRLRLIYRSGEKNK
jgi:hypothetical protein